MGYYTPYTRDGFSARYRRRLRYLVGTFLPWVVIFGGLTVGPFHPVFDEIFAQEPPGHRYIIPAFFGFCLVIMSVEFVISAAKLITSSVALEIDRKGIRGHRLYLTRDFAWDEILDIYKMINTIYIVKKPRSAFGKFMYGWTHQGSRYRHETLISVPLKSIDVTEEEIHAAIERFSPPGFVAGLESSRRGRYWLHFELKRP